MNLAATVDCRSLIMSEAIQSEDSSLSKNSRSLCWMFTAQLKISPPPHIAMPSTDGAALPANIIPAKYFEAVLDSETCSKYQTSVLKNAEVISFSYNPEWSNLHLGDRLHVTGLVVHKYQIRRSNLSDWLVHDGLEVEASPTKVSTVIGWLRLGDCATYDSILKKKTKQIVSSYDALRYLTDQDGSRENRIELGACL